MRLSALVSGTNFTVTIIFIFLPALPNRGRFVPGKGDSYPLVSDENGDGFVFDNARRFFACLGG